MQRLISIALVVGACGSHSSSAGSDAPGGDAVATGDGATDAALDAPPVQPVCSGSDCVCADGYRPCEGGCCAVDLDVVTLDNAWGDSVRMHYAPDGTAYILVDQRTAPTATEQQLHLYERPPAGAIADTGWTTPVALYQDNFDFAIHSDGTLVIAYAPSENGSSTVELVTWKNGVASTPVAVGNGYYPYDPGVSVALDGVETLWVTWSTSQNGGLSAYSLDTGGTQRDYWYGANGTVEETRVQYSAALGSVFSFWGHRYTGSFVYGVQRLAGTATLATTCPADSAAFDSAGHLWTVYNAYPSTHTSTCLDGDVVEQAPIYDLPQLAIDAHDIAYTAGYDRSTYTATWYASPNNHGWTSGTLPTHYGVPQGWTEPGMARAALAPDGHGKMSIVVVPQAAAMGAMVLTTFR